MGRRGVPVLLAELKQCMTLERGKQLYSEAVAAGLYQSSHSATLLLSLYSRCGAIDDAAYIFNRMPCHSVVSWTSLIIGYRDNGRPDLAFELFSSCMRPPRNWEPNPWTFVAALTACSQLKVAKVDCLDRVRWTHLKAREKGCDSDLFVANTLVDVYAKCGSLVEARKVFERMQARCIVSWTCLILGYAENGDGEIALELYCRVLLEGLMVDGRVLVAAFIACESLAASEDGVDIENKNRVVKLRSLERTMAIHGHAARTGHLSVDVFVANALMDAYNKCGSVSDAARVFDTIQHHDVVSWTSYILGFVEAGEMELALETYDEMKQRCVPNDRTFVVVLKACSCLGSLHKDERKTAFLETGQRIHAEATSRGCDDDIYVASSLVAMYASCGCLARARSMFDAVASKSSVAWNVMLAGYVENGENLKALELVRQMRRSSRLLPTAHTFVAALEACAASTSFGAGVELHGDICRAGMDEDRHVATSLVDFYGKCGSVTRARQTFDSLSSKMMDTAAWSSLISGFGRLADAQSTLTLVESMQREGIEPDSTVVLEVLTACSHAGLVDQGREYFARARRRGSVGINHYNCVVDMLGRANRPEEAMAVVKGMPEKANSMTWRTMLAACRKWDNVELGKQVFGLLMRMDEREAASYVIMANLQQKGGEAT